jgi:tetratricopeptide (TPR) repeat protein
MKDAYTILGVSRDATDEEIRTAYRNLARKYHPDNYADDNPLKELANEKMQEINAAYDEIQRNRATGSSYSSGSYSSGSSSTGSGGSNNQTYYAIRQKIQANRIAEAERMLAAIGEFDRNAEWHYLTAVCLMQRGRPNDAMRELEIACMMDPSNTEYQKAKEMFNTTARGYGNTYYGGGGYGYGGYRRSDVDRACDCCTNLICLDCLCECMGGDLIRCI